MEYDAAFEAIIRIKILIPNYARNRRISTKVSREVVYIVMLLSKAVLQEISICFSFLSDFLAILHKVVPTCFVLFFFPFTNESHSVDAIISVCS